MHTVESNFERIAKLRASEARVLQLQVNYNVQQCLKPERDKNAWLAATLASRPGWGESSELLRYVVAAPFAVLPESVAPAVFALRLLFDEDPIDSCRLEPDFEILAAPVFQLASSGEFSRMWRNQNPWTASRFPEVADGIAMTMRDLPGIPLESLEFMH